MLDPKYRYSTFASTFHSSRYVLDDSGCVPGVGHDANLNVNDYKSCKIAGADCAHRWSVFDW